MDTVESKSFTVQPFVGKRKVSQIMNKMEGYRVMILEQMINTQLIVERRLLITKF